MRSNTSPHVRRNLRHAEARTRRRPLLVAGALTVGILATAGITATAPTSEAQASSEFGPYALASFTTPASLTTTVTASEQANVAARDALTTAQTSLTAATTVSADIAASGLDVGVPVTSVDTTKLLAAVVRLEGAGRVPAILLPSITAEVTVQTAAVDGHVAGLRAALDAAKAKKAEVDAAAEQARIDAEAAAAAAAAASSSSSTSSTPVATSGGGSGDNSPAGAKATARGMLAGYGWGDDQFSCLESLWDRESGWNYQASNASSGAYGIPQALPGSKMASAGADWQTNAATQISWGLGYISGRYATPCGAWSHSESNGWY